MPPCGVAGDLRFTPDEAAAFLSRMINVAVDDATTAALEAKTEGWAAGLRLAGLYLQGQSDGRRGGVDRLHEVLEPAHGA